MTTKYTPDMKTAISIPDPLFHEVEKAAKENHLSRSEVFVIAVREYLEKRKARKLLNELNEALSIAETEEEYAVRQKSKKRYARTLSKERT
jgi:metal-responsive CopG/Arc/MetJ family transcriptional regulator